MANDEIKDITEGSAALGENKFTEGLLLDVAIKAGEVVRKTSTGIALNDYYYTGDPLTIRSPGDWLGVMKEHYEFDLDTDITAGKYGDVITEGYCAIFIRAPGKICYAGTTFYGDNLNPGQLHWSSVAAPIAKLKRDVAIDATVGIFKLII